MPGKRLTYRRTHYEGSQVSGGALSALAKEREQKAPRERGFFLCFNQN
jgi:hypothetical protein